MTVINIFRYTASVDALIWASALASLIAMVMFFVQCILSLREFMEVSSIVHTLISSREVARRHIELSRLEIRIQAVSLTVGVLC